MVEKSYSDARPNEVSVERVGKFTSVWLRKNIVEDTADQGPDGSESVTFWTWDEVFFSVPGNMTESEASERFDELWSAHRDDGRPAEEVAAEARAAAEKAKAAADEAKTTADTSAASMNEYLDALLGLDATDETEATDAE